MLFLTVFIQLLTKCRKNLAPRPAVPDPSRMITAVLESNAAPPPVLRDPSVMMLAELQAELEYIPIIALHVTSSWGSSPASIPHSPTLQKCLRQEHSRIVPTLQKCSRQDGSRIAFGLHSCSAF